MPKAVVRAALQIRIALERDGIAAARLVLEAARRPDFVGTPGVERPSPPEPVPRVAGDHCRALTFEIDDERAVQLLCRDGATPVRIGQRRHVALLHHVYRHGPVSLFDALRASGTDANRAENVYYEARTLIGPQWFRLSGAGSSQARLLRLVAPQGCTVGEQRVATLTDAPPARRSR